MTKDMSDESLEKFKVEEDDLPLVRQVLDMKEVKQASQSHFKDVVEECEGPT